MFYNQGKQANNAGGKPQQQMLQDAISVKMEDQMQQNAQQPASVKAASETMDEDVKVKMEPATNGTPCMSDGGKQMGPPGSTTPTYNAAGADSVTIKQEPGTELEVKVEIKTEAMDSSNTSEVKTEPATPQAGGATGGSAATEGGDSKPPTGMEVAPSPASTAGPSTPKPENKSLKKGKCSKTSVNLIFIFGAVSLELY